MVHGVPQLDVYFRMSGLQHRAFSHCCSSLLLYFGIAWIFGGLHACTHSALAVTRQQRFTHCSCRREDY